MPSFVVKSYTATITNATCPNARITLFEDEQGTSDKMKACIGFGPLAEHTTPSFRINGNILDVSMHFSAYAGVLDLLRNENPVTFYWYPDTQICAIEARAEPVGEGEGGVDGLELDVNAMMHPHSGQLSGPRG